MIGRVMRVAVSTDDTNGLDSVVSPHFGRCPYYVFVDLEGQEVRQVSAEANPFFEQHAPGQVPTFIHQQGVDVMLTGGMGMRAIGFFEQYGIQPVTGASGTVRHALEQFLGGQLQGAEPCRESSEHAHEPAVPEGEYEKDAVGRLREEADMLQQQLGEVMGRLDRLTGS
jgi:predicted Fe-Mo cluster-binding NifX family protein